MVSPHFVLYRQCIGPVFEISASKHCCTNGKGGNSERSEDEREALVNTELGSGVDDCSGVGGHGDRDISSQLCLCFYLKGEVAEIFSCSFVELCDNIPKICTA